jgi:hypothetical protein
VGGISLQSRKTQCFFSRKSYYPGPPPVAECGRGRGKGWKGAAGVGVGEEWFRGGRALGAVVGEGRGSGGEG